MAHPSPTAADGVGAAGAVLPGDELAARLPRLRRLTASPLPVVELFPISLLAAPQHRHRAPGLLHHLHDAVQRLQGGKVFSALPPPCEVNSSSEVPRGPSQEDETRGRFTGTGSGQSISGDALFRQVDKIGTIPTGAAVMLSSTTWKELMAPAPWGFVTVGSLGLHF